jgi:hypothetical protein
VTGEVSFDHWVPFVEVRSTPAAPEAMNRPESEAAIPWRVLVTGEDAGNQVRPRVLIWLVRTTVNAVPSELVRRLVLTKGSKASGL